VGLVPRSARLPRDSLESAVCADEVGSGVGECGVSVADLRAHPSQGLRDSRATRLGLEANLVLRTAPIEMRPLT